MGFDFVDKLESFFSGQGFKVRPVSGRSFGFRLIELSTDIIDAGVDYIWLLRYFLVGFYELFSFAGCWFSF